MTDIATPGSKPPWGTLATTLWTIASFVAGIMAAYVVNAIWFADRAGGANDGVVVAATLAASIPVQVAVLVVAAWLRGWSLADYFALVRPKRAEVITGLVALVLLIVVLAGLLLVSGRDMVTAFQIETYRSAKEAGWLIPLFIVFVLVAPAGEELVFRGFMFRGWARPGNELYVIVIIAGLFAALHIQYDWVGILQVFALGLVFGWFRWASGSTALTILMHAVTNLEATLETIIKVEWLS